MRCVTEPDLPTFAERALPFLERDPVRNNAAHTVVAERFLGGWPTEPGALWVSIFDDAGELVGVALRTPPYPILLSDMPHAAVNALTNHLATTQPRLTGVYGPVGLARRFATRWAALTGARVAPAEARRLFRLHQLTPPADVPGRLREAGPDDRDLMVRWAAAFTVEAEPTHSPADPAHPIDTRLAHGGLLWLWEDRGRPVSSLWLHLPAAGVVRISGVYTPPERRRRGYASACVAGVSAHVLNTGALTCILNTDLANPTSNKIYQEIGYRPVRDTQIWRFQPPDG